MFFHVHSLEGLTFTSVTRAAVGGDPGRSCFFAKFEACKHRKLMNGTYFERGDDNLSEYYRII